MEIIVNTASGITEIWVPNDTPEDLVQHQLQRCKDAGQYAVVFRSGPQDLIQATQDLLAQNI